MKLILASTSPYRKALLQRLYPGVTCVAPEVAEDPAPEEPPAELAARLARAKAVAVAAHHPDAVVIGSDQVASLDGRAMGKPLDHRRATAQLRACSGRAVRFDTAVTVIAPGPTGRFEETRVVPFTAHFRPLGEAEIDTYLRRDTPYDCAGSFKWESLGIVLFNRLEGDDPTSLEGLPLIALSQLLARAGHPVLGAPLGDE